MDLLALDSRRGAKTSACVPAPSARTGQHARVNVCVRARALRAQRALATGPFARQHQLLPFVPQPWWTVVEGRWITSIHHILVQLPHLHPIEIHYRIAR